MPTGLENILYLNLFICYTCSYSWVIFIVFLVNAIFPFVYCVCYYYFIILYRYVFKLEFAKLLSGPG